MNDTADTLVFLPAWNEEDNLPVGARRDTTRASAGRRPGRRRRLDRPDGRGGSRARRGGGLVRRQQGPPRGNCRRLRVRSRARIRLLHARRRRRPASRRGARAPAGACSFGRLRRSRRLALRERRRLRSVSVQAFGAAPLRDGAAAALDERGAPEALLRRDQRDVRGEREGDGGPGAPVHDAKRPRSRRSCASRRRACGWTRCRSTCARARAASRSSGERRHSWSS